MYLENVEVGSEWRLHDGKRCRWRLPMYKERKKQGKTQLKKKS